MNPRSLVGMSQSARKRWARAEAMGGDAFDMQPRRIWLMWWRDFVSDPSIGVPDSYPALRTKYRIGERLRPCLVCMWARCPLPCSACSTCDGSGVLPARKAVR